MVVKIEYSLLIKLNLNVDPYCIMSMASATSSNYWYFGLVAFARVVGGLAAVTR